jgi:hypothetical protein
VTDFVAYGGSSAAPATTTCEQNIAHCVSTSETCTQVALFRRSCHRRPSLFAVWGLVLAVFGCSGGALLANAQYTELGGVKCSTSTIASPGTANCTVQMTGTAPSGGLGIHMSSSNAGVSVPTWVVVQAGYSSAPFAVDPTSGLSGTVILTATFNGVSKTVQLQIGSTTSPQLASLSCSNPTLWSPGTANCTVKLGAAAPSSGLGIHLTSNNTGVSVPTSVVVPSGSSSAPFSADVSTGVSSTVTLTGTLNGVTKSVLLHVHAIYYLAPAGAGGDDLNDGLSESAPWLTPKHSVNCGDIIQAASGSYDAQNFTVGDWGTVSCATANNVAWLECAKFDTCRISTNSLSSGIWVDRSFWGVQGWEITTQKGGGEPACFVVAPNWNNPVEVHHVILANNIANGCQSGGISTANHPGTHIGVDYLVVVGNIAYNSTQGTSECYTGISVYAPMASDSNVGTHIYLAGNFSWNNFDPDYCGGGPATDGEGLMFDWVDASNQNLANPPYSQQMVADNNLLIGNGGPGLQVDHDNAGSGPWATIYTRHNTMWGNNHDQTLKGIHGEMLWGTVKNTYSSYDLAVPNIQTGGGGYPVDGYMISDSPGTSGIDNSWAYSPWGNNIQVFNSSGFTIGTNNIFGVDPQLTNPVVPGAPNCSAFSSVPACMATVIANFKPKNQSAIAYGYQVPKTTLVQDPLFPHWLCSVTKFPAGLVTMGCAQ